MRVLLLALTDDVGAERVAGSLARAGARCALLSPPGFLCAHSRFVERHVRLPRHAGLWLGMLAARRRIEQVTREFSPDLLLPLDDVAAWLLRHLAASGGMSAAATALFDRSLGRTNVEPFCSRSHLMRLAASLEVGTPRWATAATADEAMARASVLGFPSVLKAEYTCGGRGVVIARTPGEVERGWAQLKPAAGTLKAWRAGQRHRLWRLAGLTLDQAAPILMQSYVAGRPAMRTLACRDGEVLDAISFVAEHTHPGPTGTSTVVTPVEDAVMEDSATRLVRGLGCSGIVSLDFILPSSGEAAVLIEMNARPIGTSHLGARFGHDLAGALLGRARVPAYLPFGAVAMFPKELWRRDAEAVAAAPMSVFHDVPEDDPALIAAHLRRSPRLAGLLRALEQEGRGAEEGRGSAPSPAKGRALGSPALSRRAV